MKTKNNPEFERFDEGMDALLKVSHDNLKTALETEKAAKKSKMGKPKKTSAEDHASRAKN